MLIPKGRMFTLENTVKVNSISIKVKGKKNILLIWYRDSH